MPSWTENQSKNPTCLFCNSKFDIQKIIPQFNSHKSDLEELCSTCNQINYFAKCPKCFTVLISKKQFEIQIEIFCSNVNCPIGQENLQNEIELDSLGISVMNEFDLQNYGNPNENIRSNRQPIQQGMELEEQKQNQEGNAINNNNMEEENEDQNGNGNNRQILQEKYFKKIDPQTNFVNISCYNCSNEIKLARKKENLVYLNYKSESCTNCSQIVYYTICECGELIYSYVKFSESIIECSSNCEKLQTFECKAVQDLDNNQCDAILKYSIKNNNEINQFYKRSDCEKCGIPAYYFYCQCSQLIVQRYKPFLYGDTIYCPNDKCHLKKFQLVRCPLDHCQQTNVFKGNYSMGDIIKCIKCENDFQQVTCPQCQDCLYFQGEYALGGYLQCPCEIIFQQVSCTYCKKAQFRIKDRDPPIQSGMPITCDNPECLKEYYCISCPQCHQNIKKIETTFKEGQFYSCDTCQIDFEFYVCKNGHINQHKEKKQDQKHIKRDFYSFGHRKCQFPNCEQDISILFCPHSNCKKLNKFDEKIEINKTIQCQFCQKNFLTAKCDGCKSLNSLTSNNMTIQCFQCRKEISTMDADDPNAGLCKICYTDRVIYVMDKCMHVVCCEECMPRVREENKCPLCRKRGEPKKLYF